MALSELPLPDSHICKNATFRYSRPCQCLPYLFEEFFEERVVQKAFLLFQGLFSAR